MSNDSLYQQVKAKRLASLPVYRWKRQDKQQWRDNRAKVWKRDQGACQSPGSAAPKLNGLCLLQVALNECHIDHIRPLSSGGSNHHSNLRVLCPVCHALRSDEKHSGMRTDLVSKGVLPIDWKVYIWDELPTEVG